MNLTISILDINIDQSQQSFLRTVGVLAKTAVLEFCLFYIAVESWWYYKILEIECCLYTFGMSVFLNSFDFNLYKIQTLIFEIQNLFLIL